MHNGKTVKFSYLVLMSDHVPISGLSPFLQIKRKERKAKEGNHMHKGIQRRKINGFFDKYIFFSNLLFMCVFSLAKICQLYQDERN